VKRERPEIIPIECGACSYFTKTGRIDRFKGHCSFFDRDTYKTNPCFAEVHSNTAAGAGGSGVQTKVARPDFVCEIISAELTFPKVELYKQTIGPRPEAIVSVAIRPQGLRLDMREYLSGGLGWSAWDCQWKDMRGLDDSELGSSTLKFSARLGSSAFYAKCLLKFVDGEPSAIDTLGRVFASLPDYVRLEGCEECSGIVSGGKCLDCGAKVSASEGKHLIFGGCCVLGLVALAVLLVAQSGLARGMEAPWTTLLGSIGVFGCWVIVRGILRLMDS
jgi:hypothetical protein